MSCSATILRLLVVDDEPDLLSLYELTLRRAGYQVESAGNLARARERLTATRYDGVITDMRLPDGLGTELVREVTRDHPQSRILVITAYGSTDNAVEALKAGAFDYLTKPVDLGRFRDAVAAALASRTPLPARADSTGTAPMLTRQPHEPRQTSGAMTALAALVGSSPAMVAIRQRIERVAPSMAPVLILGEPGTGKELTARTLHACSHRRDGPFIAVDCGAIPEHRFKAEFFGTHREDREPSTQHHTGCFQAASGGTLFLDEIDALSTAQQARLLRALQERRSRPLGSGPGQAIDVRLVGATRTDLAQAVRQGLFRHDLYYLLNVIEIRLPALHERREDLEDLASALLRRLCQDSGLPLPRLSAGALAWLRTQPLPGNLRELENLLHRGLALGDQDPLQAEDLQAAGSAPTAAGNDDGQTPASTDPTRPGELIRHLDATERRVLEQALHEGQQDLALAAARLGLSPAQLRYRLQRLGIPAEPMDP